MNEYNNIIQICSYGFDKVKFVLDYNKYYEEKKEKPVAVLTNERILDLIIKSLYDYNFVSNDFYKFKDIFSFELNSYKGNLYINNDAYISDVVLYGIPVVVLNEKFTKYDISFIYKVDLNHINSKICKKCKYIGSDLKKTLLDNGLLCCCNFKSDPYPPVECPYYLEHCVSMQNT